MGKVLLKSDNKASIKELVIDALEAEKKELLAALLKTKECLAKFEAKYHISTLDFISRNNESLNLENMEAVEWQGEYETLKQLEEKLNLLKEIKVCT
jgi:hypothetical protein